MNLPSKRCARGARLRRSFAWVALLCAGCGNGGEGVESSTDTPDPRDAVDEARSTLPDYLSLHGRVISRTCSPDEGVCHHSREYPNLASPQSMLGAIGADCNLAVGDPADTFNGCERRGDRVEILAGANAGFATEIAWIEAAFDPSEMLVGYTLTLRDAIPSADDDGELDSVAILRDYEDGSVDMGRFDIAASYQVGARTLRLEGVVGWQPWQHALMEGGLVLGDPNRDGVFGADEEAFEIFAPGDPERSYLLGRVLGRVPGTPMPLANQALSSAEMLALTCWIEGLIPGVSADVYASIDYDNCQAAIEFGTAQPGSGRSFSEDIMPILARCSAAGCHARDAPAAGLDLESDDARDNLLATSTQDPETPRVTPGNPTHSYLMSKLRGKGVAGLRMPRTLNGEGEPLSEEELSNIEAWIVAGAPDD